MSFLKHLIKNAYYEHQYNSKHNADLQSSLEPPGFIGNSLMLRHFLKNGKKIVLILLVIIGVILLLLIMLFFALSPIILSSIDWVYHNGLSGIVRLLQSILDNLWKGAGA